MLIAAALVESFECGMAGLGGIFSIIVSLISSQHRGELRSGGLGLVILSVAAGLSVRPTLTPMGRTPIGALGLQVLIAGAGTGVAVRRFGELVMGPAMAAAALGLLVAVLLLQSPPSAGD